VTARGEYYDFSYSTRASGWQSLLMGADGSILSSKVAGGYVGAVVGLYAHSTAGPLD
jgi:xylan 1,4-beta-xylosidase